MGLANRHRLLGINMTGRKTSSNIFAQLLGEQYQRLPKVIKLFHDTPHHFWKGSMNATGSDNPLAKFIRIFMGFPEPSNNLPITVYVNYTEKGEECWTRSFGNKKFSSLLMVDKKIQR